MKAKNVIRLFAVAVVYESRTGNREFIWSGLTGEAEVRIYTQTRWDVYYLCYGPQSEKSTFTN